MWNFFINKFWKCLKKSYYCKIGKHGIQLFFEDRCQNSSTSLSEVPVEKNINKETTSQHLIEKADSNGKLKDIDIKLKMIKYQSIKLFMTYENYLNYNKSVIIDL